MRRKSRGQLVSVIGLTLVFISVVVSSFFDGSGKIVSTIATVTAIIGAFAIYVQIRKSKLIGQSSFTIEISKYLYEIPGLTDFVRKLGRSEDVNGVEYTVPISEHKILIKYLNYIKTLASLVEEKTVNIETLDNVFAYEFFIVVNNKSVQELEIKPFARFYHDVFLLYDKWIRYIKKQNRSILHEENSLANLEEYKAFMEEVK